MVFARLTPLADATAWIDREVAGSLEAECLSLSKAPGRVLARDVVAERDSPPFDRAATDGYALLAGSTLGASAYNPVTFRFDRNATGTFPSAAPIALGSALPPDADAVVPRQLVELDAVGNSFEIIEPVAVGTNVERVGAGFCEGTRLLRSGVRLGPNEMGLLAESGIELVEVVRRPHVRLVVTSSDVAPLGSGVPRGAAFDVDAPMLTALIERDGGTVEIRRPGRESWTAIRKAVAVQSAEIVIVIGGSGLGANDLVVLEALRKCTPGDQGLAIHGIAFRPGSSAGIGRIAGMPFFLLPGSPVSCLWAYEMLAGRAVRRLSGRAPGLPYLQYEFATARKIVSDIGFVEIRPVRLTSMAGVVEPISGAPPEGTGGLFATVAEADGFVVIPEGSEGIRPGTRASVYLYDDQRASPSRF